MQISRLTFISCANINDVLPIANIIFPFFVGVQMKQTSRESGPLVVSVTVTNQSNPQTVSGYPLIPGWVGVKGGGGPGGGGPGGGGGGYQLRSNPEKLWLTYGVIGWKRGLSLYRLS